jgi:hypothetical protein
MSRSACAIVIAWFIFLTGLCSSLEAQRVDSPNFGPIPKIFAISSVAYRDFESQLKQWERKWQADRRAESEMQRYASDIRNYEMTLFAFGGKVYVTFTMRPFHGTESFGGTTHYVLDDKTGAVLEHTGER